MVAASAYETASAMYDVLIALKTWLHSQMDIVVL